MACAALGRNIGTTYMNAPVLMPSGGMMILRAESGRAASRMR